MRERAAKGLPEGFEYSCIEEFVLKNGRFYPIDKPSPIAVKRGVMKECFRNATLAALADDRLTYVEGYADCGVGIPMMHAWLVDAENRVIEVTWKQMGSDYYGVPFNTEFIRKVLPKMKHFGFLDNWRDRWPLLRGQKGFETPREKDAPELRRGKERNGGRGRAVRVASLSSGLVTVQRGCSHGCE